MVEFERFYHVYTKSISSFRIFRRETDFRRITRSMLYYQYGPLPMSFADFMRLNQTKEMGFENFLNKLSAERMWLKRVQVVAYCIMSTHLHLIVRELQPGSLSPYMADLLNSYTRYFNSRYDRKGPLWQGRFGRRSIAGYEDFLQTTAYVHLNPVTEFMVEKPDQWPHSSYPASEPLSMGRGFLEYVQMDPKDYTRFVIAQIKERRARATAKKFAKHTS
jgi:putative transposase